MTRERVHAAVLIATLLICSATSLKMSGSLSRPHHEDPPRVSLTNLSMLMLSHSDVVQILTGAGKGAKIAGMGFAARPDGVILTARRAVEGGCRVRIRFKSGVVQEGRVYTDDSSPLALIRVDAADLNAFGFKSYLPPPESVAMRTAYHNAAADSVRFTGEARQDGLLAFIGSCGVAGEPLVDVLGHVVAVNLGVPDYRETRRGRTAWLALSARDASEQALRLLALSRGSESGPATRPPLWPKLGIQVAEVTRASTHVNYLPTEAHGAIVAAVFPGSPAKSGRMRAGDLLIGIGGQRIHRAEEVAGAIESLEPGRDAGIMVERLGGRFLLPVTAGDCRPAGHTPRPEPQTEPPPIRPQVRAQLVAD